MNKDKSNMSRQPWFPVIALIITYAFLIGVFVLTTSVFKPEGGSNIDEIDSALSIWLCAITAVCTILPVVLGIKQNMEMDRQARRTEQQFQELKESCEREMESMIDDKRKTIAEYERLRLRHILSSIIMQVDTLCSIQDFQYKGSAVLAEKNLTKRLLKALDESARLASTLFCDNQENIDESAREEIMGSVLSALTSVRHLSLVFLPLATSAKSRFDVQGVADRISLCLRDKTMADSLGTGWQDLRDGLYELASATGKLRGSIFS